MRIKQIKEYDWELYNSKTNGLDHNLIAGLIMSKRNTKVKLSILIKKMQEHNLWLEYLESNPNKRPIFAA